MKYFFFDIDGTLTNIHTGQIVPSALETLRRLEANGHMVAIATGRAYYKTTAFAEKAGIRNLVANGGAAFVIDGKLVRNRPLDREKALTVIREADALGYGILVAINDSTDVVMRDQRFIEQAGERREPTNYILKENMEWDDLEDIYKIYISIPEEEEYRMKNRDLLGHIRMNTPYFWYQHDAKDEGIRDMVAYMGGDIHDVVVFGDGENDMVMFRKEWTSIAMGNGYPPLLEKADYVTDAAEDDGIRNACLHFGWID
ncbi:MAG TPA: hydrolase [Erysipelotrichaceae bacterium]|nr:hydrolase [Erysipelotrichaceae bacterium]